MKHNRLLKHFYGISGPLDEYKMETAFRLGNQVVVPLFLCLFALGFLGMTLSYRFPTLVAYGLPALSELVLLSIFHYLAFTSFKSRLIAIEQEELTPKENKLLPWLSLLSGVYFTLFMYLGNSLLHTLIEQTDFVNSLLHPRTILASCLSGLFFGGFVSFSISLRIKKGREPIPSSTIVPKEPQWLLNLIKRFYGIRGPFDEYRRKEADKIGGLTLVYLSYFLLFGNALAFFLAIRFSLIVAKIYPFIMLIALFICRMAIDKKIDKSRIQEVQLAELEMTERKWNALLPLYLGLGAAFLSTLFAATSDLFNLNQGILHSLLHPKVLFFGGFMGIFAAIGVAMVNAVRKCEQETYHDYMSEEDRNE